MWRKQMWQIEWHLRSNGHEVMSIACKQRRLTQCFVQNIVGQRSVPVLHCSAFIGETEHGLHDYFATSAVCIENPRLIVACHFNCSTHPHSEHDLWLFLIFQFQWVSLRDSAPSCNCASLGLLFNNNKLVAFPVSVMKGHPSIWNVGSDFLPPQILPHLDIFSIARFRFPASESSLVCLLLFQPVPSNCP